jgi:hypothetical protein
MFRPHNRKSTFDGSAAGVLHRRFFVEIVENVCDWAVATAFCRRRPENLNSISNGALRLRFLVPAHVLDGGVGVNSSSREGSVVILREIWVLK